MIQQLSLYSHLPDTQLKMVLHTLVAICGMRPDDILEHSLVWKPTNPFVPVLSAGQVNQIEQYGITMTHDLNHMISHSRGAITLKNGAVKKFDAGRGNYCESKLAERQWGITIFEVPEAGKRKVVSQSISKAKIKEGNPFEFAERLGYSFAYEYWTKGYKLIHGNAIIRIFRVYKLKKGAESIEEDIMEVDGPETTAETELELLDGSKRWIIKVYINVSQITDLEGLHRATSELEKIKVEVNGLFELSLPVGSSFDTRIRNR
ncbi:hypothetical protein NADFUDRAFT_53602 [Nadsonia fulvescens var. elongata DSM 6958]|uniref:Mediator of RNA polymerase II transcription subunit 18 n=1 Tax=Nadsonia fulvescens var. elongata DSM 6958 TaxID=857566 RepID=A0A1E3PD46_9ASCO|nr:hypothetical protein NADFUDRAFT_53602 [Nadsonia fulvescens var. elongata DSM 6958]